MEENQLLRVESIGDIVHNTGTRSSHRTSRLYEYDTKKLKTRQNDHYAILICNSVSGQYQNIETRIDVKQLHDWKNVTQKKEIIFEREMFFLKEKHAEIIASMYWERNKKCGTPDYNKLREYLKSQQKPL